MPPTCPTCEFASSPYFRPSRASNSSSLAHQPSTKAKPWDRALSRVRKTFRSCGHRTAHAWKTVQDASVAIVNYLWKGQLDEEPKVVLRQGWKWALVRCWSHVLSLTGTMALAYYNLAGHFVCFRLEDWIDPISQKLDILMLQVAAKLLVTVLLSSPLRTS
jgi:hypothetical protein